MPKTATSLHPITKHPERTQEFQHFYSVLQKTIGGSEKNGKSAPVSAVISAPMQADGLRQHLR